MLQMSYLARCKITAGPIGRTHLEDDSADT